MSAEAREQIQMSAAEHLREAWYLLVAAGRMTDAARVKEIAERLEQAAEGFSPRPAAAVDRRRAIAEDSKTAVGSVSEPTPRAVTRPPADLCIAPAEADNLYCRLPSGHAGEHDLDWTYR